MTKSEAINELIEKRLKLVERMRELQSDSASIKAKCSLKLIQDTYGSLQMRRAEVVEELNKTETEVCKINNEIRKLRETSSIDPTYHI